MFGDRASNFVLHRCNPRRQVNTLSFLSLMFLILSRKTSKLPKAWFTKSAVFLFREECVAEELRGDREIVMTAVSRNWWALEYATEELRGDRDIVMTALSQHWQALRFATEELRGDCEIIEAALRDKDALALTVTLLSGRCCTQLFFSNSHPRTVLRECATLLNMEPNYVVAVGTLVQETRVIDSLQMLEAGKRHELTLVLS